MDIEACQLIFTDAWLDFWKSAHNHLILGKRN